MKIILKSKIVESNLILFFLINLLFSMSSNIAFSAVPPNAPKTKYWVTDQAGILSTSIEMQLTQNAITHEKNTTDQVVTVTVRSLDGLSIESYGRWLGNDWGIGQEAKNNGVLFLIAPNERKVRIEVGSGLGNKIPDSLAKSILDHEILPYFKKNEMQKGIVAGHQAIIQALDGEYVDKSWWDKFVTFILLPFFVIGRVLGFGGRFSGGGGSFGGGGASGSW